MVRIGTCGGLQPNTPTGCFVASVKSIGFDGLLNYYADRNKVCDLKLEEAFKQHMNWNPIKGAPYVSVADAEALSTALQRTIWFVVILSRVVDSTVLRVVCCVLTSRIPSRTRRLRAFEYDGLKICNFEMESSALAGMASLLGHRAMTCCMVIANRYAQKMNTEYKNSIDTLIEKVLDRI